MIDTDYLDEALNYRKFPGIIKKLARSIKRHCPNARAVAFRGNSGALVGMAVCAELKLPPLLVRKGSSHANRRVEGATGVLNFVIVDDFISSGRTVGVIIRALKKYRYASECLGVFTYDQAYDRPLKGKLSDIQVYRTKS